MSCTNHVFPPKSIELFSDGEATTRNITEYKNELLIYIDRFEDKLTLFGCTEQGCKYLPKRLFKKGSATANPGLADYFVGGLPRPDFGFRG